MSHDHGNLLLLNDCNSCCETLQLVEVGKVFHLLGTDARDVDLPHEVASAPHPGDDVKVVEHLRTDDCAHERLHCLRLHCYCLPAVSSVVMHDKNWGMNRNANATSFKASVSGGDATVVKIMIDSRNPPGGENKLAVAVSREANCPHGK
eukprot:4238423-Ditylum_brightwellii.AAC.1